MAGTNPRTFWTVENKVLFIGVESRGREHRWKLSPNSADKAAILREIADVLDPPERPRRRAARVIEHYGEDEYYDDDDEDDREPVRRPRRRTNQQVAQPYPPVDPRGRFAGEIIDHSRGYTPDGRHIETPIPDDPAEAAAYAALSMEAYEKAQAHANAANGQDPIVNELPIIEARPKAVRRSQALDTQGRAVLPPTAHQELGEGQRVRKRPKLEDPQFYYKDTH